VLLTPQPAARHRGFLRGSCNPQRPDSKILPRATPTRLATAMPAPGEQRGTRHEAKGTLAD